MSFKVGGGREWNLEAVPGMGPGAKPLLEGLRSENPEADDIFVKISYFVTVFRMT